MRREWSVDENKISRMIVESAIEVHRTLGGPGLLESVYEEALAWELTQRGLSVERQKAIPLIYKGVTISPPLRIDLIVDDMVIVECKAMSQYNDLFEAQTLRNCLKTSWMPRPEGFSQASYPLRPFHLPGLIPEKILSETLRV
jgi:GxxExxY protein